MANRHFGRIGDIWKHLPLAEILNIERPRRYWESHAGSARYPLTHSVERDYGIFHFFNHTSEHPSLCNSVYWAALTKMAVAAELTDYPGSPLIAMSVLDEQLAHYLFADIDPESLTTIRVASQQLHIDKDRLVVIEGDGATAIEQAGDELPPGELASTFVHLDPYRPFLKSTSGVSCVELFARLTARGVRTMLWYGFDSHEYRDMLVASARNAFTIQESAGQAARIWCGEIILAVFDDPTFDYNPGVLACGILCGNLSDESVVACDRLGKGLVEIYKRAVLPSGRSGAIRFRSERINC